MCRDKSYTKRIAKKVVVTNNSLFTAPLYPVQRNRLCFRATATHFLKSNQIKCIHGEMNISHFIKEKLLLNKSRANFCKKKLNVS